MTWNPAPGCLLYLSGERTRRIGPLPKAKAVCTCFGRPFARCRVEGGMVVANVTSPHQVVGLPRTTPRWPGVLVRDSTHRVPLSHANMPARFYCDGRLTGASKFDSFRRDCSIPKLACHS